VQLVDLLAEDTREDFLLYYNKYYKIVEALQVHTNTQSHWSSGSTIRFPPRGAAVRIPGMHPHLQWNQVLLLDMSPFMGDPRRDP
jgi:hypothetical protein